MANLTETKRQLNKRVLIYGPPKVGKSQLAATLAEKHKLLWIDIEAGSDILFKLPIEFQKNIELIRIPDRKSEPVAIDTVTKLFKRATGEICHDHGKFRCPLCTKLPDYKDRSDFVDMAQQQKDNKYIVVLDSLTQLTSSAKSHITRGKGDDYKFQHDDWGRLGVLMDTVLSEIQAAAYDIVCISHDDMVETVDGKEQIVPVAGTRNFSRNTAKYFSDVVYCEVKNGKHIAASATTYQNRIQTGSRSDIKLEDMSTPSLLPFFAHREVQ